MIVEKKSALRTILQSSKGLHLTAYLENRNDPEDLKSQLKEIIEEAKEFLEPAQNTEQMNKFLEPLVSVLNDGRIMNSMKGNVGIFRTEDSFRILNIPVTVEKQIHVASSFHVKPLLKWMQQDRDFLILGLNRESVHLYMASQTTMNKLSTVVMPDFFKIETDLKGKPDRKQSKHISQNRERFFNWLNQWLEQRTQNSDLMLFLAGDKFLVEGFIKKNKYKNVIKTPVMLRFTEQNINEICNCIRIVLKEDSEKVLERALLEFRIAEDQNRVKKNLFQVAKAAVQGRIKKLIVADGINIYGKIDNTTGGLSIHPFDLDHEDDDILDDLAQTVLANGGDVILAPRDEIPKKRTVLAILNEEEYYTYNQENEHGAYKTGH